MNKEKKLQHGAKKKYLFHFLTCSCMCHCVDPEIMIKKKWPGRSLEFQGGRSRVLKDQKKVWIETGVSQGFIWKNKNNKNSRRKV